MKLTASWAIVNSVWGTMDSLALSMLNRLYFMEAGETSFYLHDEPVKGPKNDELLVIKEIERYP